MVTGDKKPEIVVFAGPNGSGKSTFLEILRPQMAYINADEIKKSLKCSDLEAAQIAEKQREDCLQAKKNFCTLLACDETRAGDCCSQRYMPCIR